ncbi:MAG: N-acetylmuramoyl-L-alanine amidase [Verrucomicrobiota bacterium]|jgi:N-acetylmuramoyl-L-alanine amidase
MPARILFLPTALFLGLCAFSAAAFALQAPETPSERTSPDWKANAVSRPSKAASSPSASPATTRAIIPGELATSPRFTIAIDIGHLPKKGGAISANGVFEYKFNRRLARELFERLQTSRSVRPVLINGDGAAISLPKRAEEASQQRADLFLAIHHDSVKDSYLKTWTTPDGKSQKYCDDFHGYSIFISQKNAKPLESLAFAAALGRALLKEGLTPSLHHETQENRLVLDREKGIYEFDDLIVLKAAKMPAVLLECGVIVNREEEAKLNDPAYRNRIIEAISSAVEGLAVTAQSSPQKKD